MTQIRKRLVAELRKIWNDKDFVRGIITYLETDEECEEMLSFISKNKDVTASELTLMALDIDSERENEGIIVDDFLSGLAEMANELKTI